MEVANAVAKDNDVTVVGMEKAPLERIMVRYERPTLFSISRVPLRPE